MLNVKRWFHLCSNKASGRPKKLRRREPDELAKSQECLAKLPLGTNAQDVRSLVTIQRLQE
jgi:hypothetical protein